jgi:UDP-N-acetyl-D-glucosamine dehydrogenase
MGDKNSMKDELLKKIQDRTAIVGVIGLGYVGLPLAVEFAKAGFHVIGYDVSERVVSALMAGKSHIQDVPSSEVAAIVKAGLFEATTDETQLQRLDAASIAVPTPLGKTRDPDMTSSRPGKPSLDRRTQACWWCSKAPRTRERRARSCCQV